MTKHNKFFGLILAALAMVGAAFSVPALAQTVPFRSFDVTVIGSATLDATVPYTNATTTYTDIPGASVLVPATNKAWSGKQFISVCYYADATKATSTTGTIQVFVNGAAATASRRTTSSSAGQNTIAACYTAARTTGTAQTVKLQAVSGDTATFTINNLQASVRVLFAN